MLDVGLDGVVEGVLALSELGLEVANKGEVSIEVAHLLVLKIGLC